MVSLLQSLAQRIEGGAVKVRGVIELQDFVLFGSHLNFGAGQLEAAITTSCVGCTILPLPQFY